MPAADRRRGRLSQPITPVLPGQRLPHRPGGPTVAQRLQKLLTLGVAAPAGWVDGFDDRQQRRFTGGLLGPGMPRRYGQPQHVRTGAGIAGGDGVDEPAHLRSKHRFGRDHPIQPAELSGVIGV